MARRPTDAGGQPELPAPGARRARAGANAGAGKDPLAAELGRRGGLKGGKARAAKLSPERRRAIAREAAARRWAGRRTAGEERSPRPIPDALRRGTLELGRFRLECFVLDDGRPVIGLGAIAAAMIAGPPEELARRLAAAAGEDLDALSTVFTVPGDWRAGRGLQTHEFVRLCSRLACGDPAGELAARCHELLTECALGGLAALVEAAAGQRLDVAGEG